MSKSVPSTASVTARAENIGGIDSTSVELAPGVTVLTGRNATNRTSFLRALMAGIGSENVSLKGDAEEGCIELDFGDRTVGRTLTRHDGGVVFEGDPYLDDTELPDLFAFLLESNDARRAVVRKDDLRGIIMGPVDIDTIEREIAELEGEKGRLSERLEELDELKRELPSLEDRRQSLSDEIAAERERFEGKREQIDEHGLDVEASRDKEDEVESKLTAVRETRSSLEDAEHAVESDEASLKALKGERADLEDEFGSLSSVDPDEADRLESEMEDLRARNRSLDATIDELQTVIEFNEETLEDSDSLGSALASGDDDGPVTDKLLSGEGSVVCWTCGTTVERGRIDETVVRLRDLQRDRRDERESVDDRLSELETERKEVEERADRRAEIERRLEDIEEEIDRRESRLADRRARVEELEAELERLETAVEDLESEAHGEVLELHREANEVEFEIERLEDEREDVADRIEGIEAELDERAEIEARRESVSDDLVDLRTKVERIEEQAVREFNDRIETVLELLDYGNLDRIWIERAERRVREGRRKVDRVLFDLHVVRQSDTGASYEDTVDHLSESERDVTGLVFALAGYLAHDVHETCPFMLLDSVEAIDSERIATLVDYFDSFSEYLVVALLPTDARALDDDYRRIESI